MPFTLLLLLSAVVVSLLIYGGYYLVIYPPSKRRRWLAILAVIGIYFAGWLARILEPYTLLGDALTIIPRLFGR